MISAALVGGIILPIVAANFLVAGSIIATLLASIATAGAAGLLVWVSLGNPLPIPDFSSSSKTKEVNAKASDADPTALVEDPFTDWDRRFAASEPKATKATGRSEIDLEVVRLKRQGAPTYLNVAPGKRPPG
eukprot:CAMPEP_0114648454 /NCGR_PEP_ID=MMETSP0191-20121206/6419_1 /TAXON_ID=126664 /ORGANISM="Sorites sp." /LENGTH=131 /DNA_ID=CAMNT_0001861803 /DNA_START=353 /DNA_END=748 /DNA_ORIENTATION=-